VPEGSAIAVIDVFGSLVHRARGMEADSGIASYESIGNNMMAAARDRTVGGILLHIDSPGGEVSGAFPLARLIKDIAKEKPVWASVDENAWSAGYLIASQASRVLLSANGSVGSVGVVLAHVDQSKSDDMQGKKWTILSRGANKTHFNPHEPLSKGALEFANGLLDYEYGMFVDAVATSRSLSEATVRGTEAGIIAGQQAVAQGFADAHLDYRDALGEMAAHVRPKLITQGGPIMSAEVNNPQPPVVVSTTAAPTLPPVTPTVTITNGIVVNEAREIAELCMMVGKPELAATFITEGKSVAEVRKHFLSMQAKKDDDTEVISVIEPKTGAGVEQKPAQSLADRMRMRLSTEPKRRAG
jgi:signal peptide peptidase SppA